MMETVLAKLNKISFLSVTSGTVSGLKNQQKVCLRTKEILCVKFLKNILRTLNAAQQRPQLPLIGIMGQNVWITKIYKNRVETYFGRKWPTPLQGWNWLDDWTLRYPNLTLFSKMTISGRNRIFWENIFRIFYLSETVISVAWYLLNDIIYVTKGIGGRT